MLSYNAFFIPLAPYVITLICLGAVLCIVVLWLAVSAVIARKTLKMASAPVAHTFEQARRVQGDIEKQDFTDYDVNWKKQDFEIEGLHGKLRGEVVFNPCASKRSKVAVICHGHTWNRINSLKYATIFYNKGYNLVLYDHSYFGSSEGKFCTLGYYERVDLSRVIDFTRQTFGQNAFLALHGESMGAVTVLCELGVRGDIDLVVADCPFSATTEYYREVYEHTFHLPSFPVIEFCSHMAKRKYGYEFDKCRPIDDVKNSGVPICFIHGAADKFIFPHHSERMFAACKNNLSELHLVPDAGHARSYLADNDGYRKIVSDFLDKIEKVSLDVESTAAKN